MSTQPNATAPPTETPNDPTDLTAARKFAVPNRLQGKVAIVTGASSGIGQAIAIRLAAEGAKVVIDYVGKPEGADDTCQTIARAGGTATTVQADVTKCEDIEKLVAEAYSRLGRCDILINNAGVEKGKDFWEVTEQEYDFVLNVNLKGAFFLTQAFVR